MPWEESQRTDLADVFLKIISMMYLQKRYGKGYRTLVHQYQSNGYNIVMDVVSGAVHVVDQLCYDVIAGICKLKEDHSMGKTADWTQSDSAALWQ